MDPLIPVVAISIVGILALIYYIRFEKPSRLTKERIKNMHFEESQFILDMKTATFKYLEAKWSHLVIVFVVVVAIAIAVPSQVLTFPMSIITSMFGVVIAMLLMVIMNKDMREKEFTEASNKAFANTTAYHPRYGFIPLLIRRIEDKGEVKLDTPQIDMVVKQCVGSLSHIPEFVDSEVTEADVESAIRTHIEASRFHRWNVGGSYQLLVVSRNSFKDMQTNENHTIIDKTIEVHVPIIPSFMVFAGTTDRVFESKDKDSKVEYLDRTMGIYVEVFNIHNMREMIIDGSFDSPTAMTALVGQLVHLYNQAQWSGDRMTKETRKREKAELISRTERFNAKAEANDIVNTTAHILKMMLALLSPAAQRLKEDIGLLFLVFALGMAAMQALNTIMGFFLNGGG